MMAMVQDSVTGMVYWVPAESAAGAPMPPFAAPIVMPYRFLWPISAVMPAAHPLQTTHGYPMDPTDAAAPRPVANTTVFVRGLPREATTQTVENHFKIYGDIQSCHVIRHKDASTNKGIAFVKFHDFAAAQRAIDCNCPGVMDQREIFAEYAHPKPSNPSLPPSRRVSDQSFENSATLAWRQLPAGPEYPRQAAPHVYFGSPASFFPAAPGHGVVAPYAATPHLVNNHVAMDPWIVTAGASSSALPGSHVFGFPHPAFTTTANWRNVQEAGGGGATVGSRENYGRGTTIFRPQIQTRDFDQHQSIRPEEQTESKLESGECEQQ